VPENPFAVLGLDPGPEPSDDDARAAFVRIAAATHPDRTDGGDPARYAASSDAYAQLKTGFGRGEATADLAARARGPARPLRHVRAGRPWFLLVRVLLVVLVWCVCVSVAGWQPATLAIGTGALTWLALTGRHDVAR
jgi:hypothetical protein